MQKVNNNSFKQEVIDSDIPVLVDFSGRMVRAVQNGRPGARIIVQGV